MKWLAVLAFVLAFMLPAAHAQMFQTVPSSGQGQEQKFPKVVYTQDHRFEVDLSWEPHQILTDQKEMFIFQFYDYKTGALVPNLDYQFVVSQDGRQLGSIFGTTTEAGDYKYFAFDSPGQITISLENIGDTGDSATFNATVAQNPHPAGPVTIVQPPPNISDRQRAIFPVLEYAFGAAIIGVIVWLAREPLIKKLRGA
ncbi:MAG: hypothetical protein KGI33_12140 [Thaumarchaeota archaeon]|nr:hypothetical protein [Nitrososphaerota archaeon]